MTLNIDYQNSDGFVLRPGSTLKGTLRFSSTKDEPISSVTLALSGRSKVKIREHLHYTTRTFRSRGYYFYNKIELFEGGNFTHKAGDYSWPFSFEIPAFAEHKVVGPPPSRLKKQLDHNGIMKPVEDQRSKDFFPATTPWRGSNDLRPHPLPDTFAADQSKWPIDLSARVEYALIARLERPTRGSLLFRAKDIETIVDLTLKAPADHSAASMLSKMKVINDDKCIFQAPTRSLSAKGMAWANAHTNKPKQTSQNPPEHIVFSVHYAIGICAQSTVPFILFAETSQPVNEPHKTVKAAVTDLTVSIVCKTSVRDDSQAATEHTATKVEKEELCFRREQQNIDLILRHDPETGKLRDKLDLEDLIHAPAFVPSFSTFNIARQYFLEYEIKIRTFGEAATVVTLKEAGLAITVLPAGSDNKTQKWSQAIPAAPPEDERRAARSNKEAEAAAERDAGIPGPPPDDEALPAYEP